MYTNADKLGQLLSPLCFLHVNRENKHCCNVHSHLTEQMAISLVRTGGARPLRIFVFETINTPGAPFFRAPSVDLTLLTLPAVSETLKPVLIKLMVRTAERGLL